MLETMSPYAGKLLFLRLPRRLGFFFQRGADLVQLRRARCALIVGFLLGAGLGRRLRRDFGLGLDFRLGLNLSFRSRFARPGVWHVVVALDPELVVEGRDRGLEPLEKRVVQRLL